MRRNDVIWARFAIIIVLSVLAVIMGFCFPVFSTLQLIIHIFIPVIAVGGAIEARG